VQLRPEHLGRVDVKLEISHDGRVQTVVQADNRQTLDMLRQDVKGLQQALRDAGLNADSQSFTFEHRQEGGQGQNQNQNSGNGGRAGASRPNEGDIISGAELAQHVAVGYGINSNGLIDIRI
jgi:flagellar hook-length control protein FliK